MLSLFLSTFLAFADQNPPGTILENAILVDVPPQGFASLEQVVPSLIPSPIEVPEFSEEGSACFIGGYRYKFLLKRAEANLNVTNIDLTVQNGYLDLNLDLEVSLNSIFDPFRFNYYLACVKYKCDGYVDPFSAGITSPLYIELIDTDGDGIKEADVSFGEDLQIDYDLTGDHIHLDAAPGGSCPIDGLESVFQFFGGSLYELVLDSIGLESIIQDALPELETTIEDAIAQASIDESVDLGGATLNIQIRPSEIQLQEEGMRMALDASASADLSECVQSYDPGGSKHTDNSSISLTEFPTGYDFGAVASDDFINQALYAVWSSGLICQQIDDSVFALDTSILNLLSGDAFKELFPESQAMVLELNPKVPPELNMETDADLAVDLEDLGLDFYADVDFRMARALSVDMDTDVGVGLGLDPATGALDLSIDLDPARVDAAVSFNEFVPDSNSLIEESFTAQLDTILGFINIEGLLGDLDFSIPAFSDGEEPVGLQGFTVLSSGGNNEDLGMYSTIGPVEYAGCASEEGSEEGCGAGCGGGGCATSGRSGGRQLLLWFVLALGVLRRRSE
ncbi:MAG: hypothetical protein VX278_01605 [Myxococcota bacterium]|nr:hypothetical protein [Myxococcota bacterium]